ncbi:hypothetical protein YASMINEVIRUS_836 [Yasminevirus sp. GU-2018]|uniref:Chromosomal protein MC1 domain-containing protein n=1 Tax=Yasminevirus sp. GU-2018 TaxID=2420051 RepID=A0A5K0UAA4_9VIRU|nr:hypothetical protein YASMINEVIRUS_836 [Yasminevirus sp. GU-2018]
MANSKTEKKTTSKSASKTATAKPAPAQKPAKAEQPAPVEDKKVAKAQAEPVAKAPVAKATKASSKAPSKSAPKKAVAKTNVKAPKNLKVAKKGANQKGGNAEELEEPGKRYFKCIMINSDDEVLATGRYSGKKPKQAASKACTKLFEDIIEEGRELPENIVFGMHECTRSSKRKKKYFYIGKRIQLEEPEEVEIKKIDPKTGKNMKITYYFNNDVRKLTDIENCAEYPRLFNYDVKEGEEQVGGKVKVVKKAKKATKTATKTASKAKSASKAKTATKSATKTASKAKAPAKASATKKPVVKKEANIKVKKNEKKPAPVAKPAKAASKAKPTKN